jgi:hypothetical protein
MSSSDADRDALADALALIDATHNRDDLAAGVLLAHGDPRRICASLAQIASAKGGCPMTDAVGRVYLAAFQENCSHVLGEYLPIVLDAAGLPPIPQWEIGSRPVRLCPRLHPPGEPAGWEWERLAGYSARACRGSDHTDALRVLPLHRLPEACARARAILTRHRDQVTSLADALLYLGGVLGTAALQAWWDTDPGEPGRTKINR